jgi:hypothetical protein
LVVDVSRCRLELTLNFDTPLVHGESREGWVTEQSRVLPEVFGVHAVVDHESSFRDNRPVGEHQPALVLHHSPKSH